MEQTLWNIINVSAGIASNIYYAEEEGPYGFRLNYNYLFIFDRSSIIYMDINQPFGRANVKNINMRMDPKETECFI